MKLEFAQRIRELPPYLFAHLDALKAAEQKRGVDVIDLGVGDPDLPTPPHIVAALATAAADPATHRYPPYVGTAGLRAAAARFYQQRFGVTLDPETEIIGLIGSKEGIAHFPVAFVEPGDLVLVPDPAYPVYATWSRFMGADVHRMPLRRERGFLPDLQEIPDEVARRARVMWLNYPNNPTAALATAEFYQEAVDFAHRHELIICSDLAYSELYFDAPPPSLLETPGARDCTIEFYSLSKTYNMTGWRVGFAAGNARLREGLAKVKTNVDSGAFAAVQRAATVALEGDQECVAAMRQVYRARRDLLCAGLREAGYDVVVPQATFYVLVGTPPGVSAVDFSARILTEAGVVLTPATGFGAAGEGYVRCALTAGEERLAEVVDRLRAATP